LTKKDNSVTQSILLTNDDGYQSPGMAAARDAFLSAGYAVITVAPDGPRSGTSRAASFRKPVTLKRHGGDDRSPIYITNGTPTDCVRVGLLSGVGAKVDAVVSGINEGANLGDDATFSSTMGSAIEGALFGFPAVAASQQSRDGRFRLIDLAGYDFDAGAHVLVTFTTQLIAHRAELPHRTVFNFNAPAQITGPLTLARLDKRVWDPARIPVVETEDGPGYMVFETHPERDPVFACAPGTDVHAISKGCCSLSVLNLDWDASGLRSRLDDLGRKLIAATKA